MGGAVSVAAPLTPDTIEVKNILTDKDKFNALFKEMSTFGHVDGHIDINDKISLTELILFIDRGANPLLSRVCSSEPVVLKTAFDFACTGSKRNHDHELTKKEFRKLLPALMLFTHFWRMFEAADSSIDDRRIFKHEFVAAKRSIESIEGVSISPISDEDWIAEFTKLDKNHNGFISFQEFSKYAVKMIVSPEFYMQRIQPWDNNISDPPNPTPPPPHADTVQPLSPIVTETEAVAIIDTEVPTPVNTETAQLAVVAVNVTEAEASENTLITEGGDAVTLVAQDNNVEEDDKLSLVPIEAPPADPTPLVSLSA